MRSLPKTAAIGVLGMVIVIAFVFSAAVFAEKRHCLRQTAVALASSADPKTQHPMTPLQVRLALEKTGYGRVHEIRAQGRYWRAEAVNRQGERVDVWFEAASGKVVREAQENCETAAQFPDVNPSANPNANPAPPAAAPLEELS